MECPTCFQKITAPQAPAPDAKFILTGTMVSKKRTFAPLMPGATAGPDKKNSTALLLALVVICAAGAAVFAFRGRFFLPVWQAVDIGDAAAGSFSRADGGFTLKGSGTDIGGIADGFHFVFQPLNGDGIITAQVLNLKDTDIWAKAGVMIRATTNDNSAFVLSNLRADGQAQMVWRSTAGAGGKSTWLAGRPGFPKWLKVERAGNVFSAYFKTNPDDVWTPTGPPQTINMPSDVKIGLVVCSRHVGTSTSAQFDQVQLQSGGKDEPK